MTDTLTPTPQAPEQPKKKSWFARHKIMTGLLAIVALIVIISAANSGGSAPSRTENTSARSGSSASTGDNTQAQAPAHKAKPAQHKPAQPAMTVSQQNALSSAKDYLSMSGFSRRGLIGQLSSKMADGYPRADAVFAVNHLHVNWNQQAVRSAKDYLSMSGFSRNTLIGQLSSKVADGYTHAQAVYAADHVGLK